MGNIQEIRKIYHAAVYVRLSKEDGDVADTGKKESNSISNQKSLIRDFLKDKEDIEIVSERVDDGYSGSNFERPQFKLMMEDIKRGIVDCVVVKDLSRFGREYIDSGRYIERLFPALGVRFIAVNDHIDSLEDGRDDIVVPFKNLMNDAYCRDISIKIRSHLEVKRKNGDYIGAFTPYGYLKDGQDKNRLVPDTYAAGIVKEIFRMKLGGMSQTAIADYLNDHDVLSPMEYKHSLGIRIQDNFKTHEQAEWSAMSVRRILENEIYTGAVVSLKSTMDSRKGKLVARPKDEWVRVDGMHEVIVTKEEFRRVQEMVGVQKPTAGRRKMRYACGVCGKRLTRRNGTDLYCNRGYMLKDCECRQVVMKEPEADAVVLGELKRKLRWVLDEEELRMERRADVPAAGSRVESLRNALEAAKKAKQRLFEKLADREIERAVFLERKKGYDAEIGRLEQEISDAGLAERIDRDADGEAREWADVARSFLDVGEMSEEIWERFVKWARVYPDGRIEVRWNFGDEMEEDACSMG